MLKQEEDKTPINFSRTDFGSYKRNNLTFLNILPSGKGEKEGGRQGDKQNTTCGNKASYIS